MAGPWLEFRGHLENISNNCLIGAQNYFNEQVNSVANYGKRGTKAKLMAVPDSGRAYKAAGVSTIVFGEENYGEGSSREHAAMEPRHIGVMAVIVKSFARIHETNLKKQGMYALTFVDNADYDKIRQDDKIDIKGTLSPGKNLTIVLNHADKTQESFEVKHTYNKQQIAWVKAGSALNKIRKDRSAV